MQIPLKRLLSLPLTGLLLQGGLGAMPPSSPAETQASAPAGPPNWAKFWMLLFLLQALLVDGGNPEPESPGAEGYDAWSRPAALDLASGSQLPLFGLTERDLQAFPLPSLGYTALPLSDRVEQAIQAYEVGSKLAGARGSTEQHALESAFLDALRRLRQEGQGVTEARIQEALEPVRARALRLRMQGHVDQINQVIQSLEGTPTARPGQDACPLGSPLSVTEEMDPMAFLRANQNLLASARFRAWEAFLSQEPAPGSGHVATRSGGFPDEDARKPVWATPARSAKEDGKRAQHPKRLFATAR